MTSKTKFSTPSATDIKVVRQFASDRETLWAMWTQADHLRNWWGPQGWTMPVCEVDFRPGGAWFHCLQDPDGNRYCSKVVYREIDALRRFTGTEIFVDEAGDRDEELPEADVYCEFSDVDGETVVTNITRYERRESRDKIIEMGVEAGISEMFDRLDEYLALQVK